MLAVRGPTVAKLLLRPRRWAHRRVRSGAWGPIVGRDGQALLVDLRNVESAIGLRFTPQQLASVGLPSNREDTNGQD